MIKKRFDITDDVAKSMLIKNLYYNKLVVMDGITKCN